MKDNETRTYNSPAIPFNHLVSLVDVVRQRVISLLNFIVFADIARATSIQIFRHELRWEIIRGMLNGSFALLQEGLRIVLSPSPTESIGPPISSLLIKQSLGYNGYWR